jgi:hypothetical protein
MLPASRRGRSATRRGRRDTRRGRRATAFIVVLGVALGLGGGTALAVWRDSASTAARMPVGVAVFGAGATGALTYAASEADRLVVPFGPAQAKVLHDAGAVSFAVQVDSLSQGHRGLTYTVTPAVAGGLFGASTWTLTKVASPAVCTTSTPGSAQRTSIPWTGTYNEATQPLSEYWCIVAKWAQIAGTHSNKVTASGTPDLPGTPAPVTATDTWSATATNDLDPTVEPTHTLTFNFRTFRGAP